MTTLKVSDVIDVGERDYMYGTGRMILRVTKIGGRQRMPDGEWLDLEGFELRPDGTQVGQRPRHALVRTTALRVHQRPPEARS